jgi:hypothetical protein
MTHKFDSTGNLEISLDEWQVTGEDCGSNFVVEQEHTRLCTFICRVNQAEPIFGRESWWQLGLVISVSDILFHAL